MNIFEQPLGPEREAAAGSCALITDTERQRLLVPELVPVYQKAFAGEPWLEVSRCEGCPRGFSAEEPGVPCGECGSLLTQEAYPAADLEKALVATIERSQTAIYVERDGTGEALLGAIAWSTTPEEVYRRKYEGQASEAMAEWLDREMPEKLIWLDEVFANLVRRPSGNLRNFQSMCERFSETFIERTIAYRSINPKIITKAVKVFGSDCTVYRRGEQVPDRRDFVILSNLGRTT